MRAGGNGGAAIVMHRPVLLADVGGTDDESRPGNL
jgi:hypothetical protein